MAGYVSQSAVCAERTKPVVVSSEAHYTGSGGKRVCEGDRKSFHEMVTLSKKKEVIKGRGMGHRIVMYLAHFPG
jgi:hypothetical protein